MLSVSTTNVVPSQRPREKPNNVCAGGAIAFGFMWIVRTESYSSSRMMIVSPSLRKSIGSGEIMMSGVPFVPHLRRMLLRGFHFASPAFPAAVSG